MPTNKTWGNVPPPHALAVSHARYCSLAALAVYTIIFVLIGYYGFRAPPHPDTPIKWFDLSGFGAWFGPCLFAFEGIGPSLAIFESLGEPSGVTFFRVITSAYVVGTRGSNTQREDTRAARPTPLAAG